MRDGYRILDADRHVLEPIEMWKEYLEPAYRDHAPYLEPAVVTETQEQRVERLGALGLLPAPPTLMIDGQPIMHPLSERARLELLVEKYNRGGELRAAMAPEGQLAVMDRDGIDVAFLYPGVATYVLGIDDLEAGLAGALARAYNNWLRDFCSRDPARLQGVGLMSAHDPDEMLTELERVAGFGWRAVVLRPNPVKGRLLSDRAYDRFWTACERLGMAVAIHEGAYTRLPTTGADRFKSLFALHACSHPMEQMMALLALVEGGVLERHPALRVAFLEAGCGWLPYWLFRLDEIEYKHLGGEVEENVRVRPSSYFQRQCFISFEPDEPYLGDVLRYIGEDKLLFGTDFPHVDHDGDIAGRFPSLRERLPESALRSILWDNAARFYGLIG